MKKEFCKGKCRSAFKLQESPCRNIAWKDGYCKIHHPEERRKKQHERNLEKEKLYNDARLKANKNFQLPDVSEVAESWSYFGSTMTVNLMQTIRYKRCLMDSAIYDNVRGIYEVLKYP